MFLLTSMTLSATADFQLHSLQQGLLMSLASLGGLAGSLLVGHVADRRGRRPPVLWSLASMATFCFLASLAPTYRVLVALGAGLGFSLGIGLVPVSVLLSETTPEGSRMAARGVSQCLGGVLGFTMLVAVQFDDATLVHLQWRRLLKGLSMSAALLCVLAASCLPESPSFLAGLQGAKQWAQVETCQQQGLPQILWCSDDLTVGRQLRVVFSDRFFLTTLFIGYGGFTLGLAQAGHQYALPQILSKQSLMAAGTARTLISCLGVPMAPAAQFTASKLSRKAAMMTLASASCVVALSAALFGSWQYPQPVGMELLFYVGISMDPYRAFLGGLLFGEIGADVYPSTTAGFGASIIAVCMGLATITAPILFEIFIVLTGHWATFYYVVAALLLPFILVTLCAGPPIEPYQGLEWQGTSGTLSTMGPQHRRNYGALAKANM